MNIQFAEVHVKPEMLEQFLELATYNATHSHQDEPGCLRFDLLQDATDPNTFYYYEVYKDDDAQKAHAESPHRNYYFERVRDLIAERGPMKRAHNLYPKDDTWR